MAEKKDLYEILGVKKNASAEELKHAYKQLVKKYHPDISKEPNAEEKLKEITHAYSILGDAEKRKQYDMVGDAAFSGGGYQDFNFSGDFDFDLSKIFSRFGFSEDDFFETFSGFRNTGFSKRQEQANLDLKTKIDIDFLTSAKGGKKEFKIDKDVSCDACEGTGSKSKSKTTCSQCNGRGRTLIKRQTPFGIFAIEKLCSKCQGVGTTITDPCKSCGGKGYVKRSTNLTVDIPAGVNNWDIIRLRGAGNQQGGQVGDLFIQVFVKNHEFFRREGFDLYCEIPIIYSDLILGTKIKIKGIQDVITLNIPSGTKPGTIFKVAGKGVPDPNKRGLRGSMFVKAILAEPVDVNREYKQLLEKLAGIDAKTKKKIQDKFKDYISFL